MLTRESIPQESKEVQPKVLEQQGQEAIDLNHNSDSFSCLHSSCTTVKAVTASNSTSNTMIDNVPTVEMEPERLNKSQSQRKEVPSSSMRVRANGEQETASLFITGLSQSVVEQDLLELFNKFGPTKKCLVMRDSYTGLSRGFAFIDYISPIDATKALSLSGSEFYEKTLIVERARKRERRVRDRANRDRDREYQDQGPITARAPRTTNSTLDKRYRGTADMDRYERGPSEREWEPIYTDRYYESPNHRLYSSGYLGHTRGRRMYDIDGYERSGYGFDYGYRDYGYEYIGPYDRNERERDWDQDRDGFRYQTPTGIYPQPHSQNYQKKFYRI